MGLHRLILVMATLALTLLFFSASCLALFPSSQPLLPGIFFLVPTTQWWVNQS